MANAKIILLVLVPLIISLSMVRVRAQTTVFSLLKKDVKLGDEYYGERNYKSALATYLRIASKDKSNTDIWIKIARCYYFLRHYDEASKWYDMQSRPSVLSPLDLYYRAEALSASKQYDKAVEAYNEYLKEDPENEFVIKKIWRLDNIRFLYEDSTHCALKPVAINSPYADIAPVLYNDGLIFLSNRKAPEIIEQVDASTNAGFFRVYFTKKNIDSLIDVGGIQYTRPQAWQLNSDRKSHYGPIAFFSDENKMVFTRTGKVAGENGQRTLQLYFAAKRDGVWQVTGAFPYNSVSYSCSDPSISDDGLVLYFSSDMQNGKGGKDLYRSQYFNGNWTTPVNLGDLNTPYDELSPYLAKNGLLYFSSNGHAGLGGLDIFKVQLTNQGFGEIQNCGYPLNTNGDEFAIVIDSLNTHGYITSNRKNGGNDDDIYEFDIDLQTYPLVIDGIVKYKEMNWNDSAPLRVMAHAKLSLIDNLRNRLVFESISDSAGNFRLEIPYFSTYKIKVKGPDNHETIVSLEIPKHRRADNSRHEIVIVKDPFKARGNETPR